jgi:hypothetical protein
VVLRGEWSGASGQGLLSSDARVRTLRKVVVTYPDVRHILPDRISLEASAEASVIEALKHLLERQQWLIKAVSVE